MSSRAGAVVLLALRYVGARRLASWVSAAAIGLSLLLVVVASLVDHGVKRAAVQGAIRYPLIVGPEGASSVQLVFSTLFYVDKPTGTIPYSVYEELLRDRRVLAAFPVAFADSLESYPIVGTNQAFLDDLAVGAAEGALDLSTSDKAVLGYEVAIRTGLRLGDSFHGSHGLVAADESEVHEAHAYRVVGVLAPTGGPEDNAVYVDFHAVWEVHRGHHEEAEAVGDKHDLAGDQLTAVLVRTANPAFTAQLEAAATLGAGTQGVDTGRAIRRLVGYLDKGQRLVQMFVLLSLAVAAGLVFVTLVMSLQARRKELALMRSLGIGRRTIASVVMMEALLVTLGGVLLGLLLGHVGVWWAEHPLRESLGIAIEPWRWTHLETWGVLCTLVAGQIIAAGASFWAYRMNLTEELARD